MITPEQIQELYEAKQAKDRAYNVYRELRSQVLAEPEGTYRAGSVFLSIEKKRAVRINREVLAQIKDERPEWFDIHESTWVVLRCHRTTHRTTHCTPSKSGYETHKPTWDEGDYMDGYQE